MQEEEQRARRFCLQLIPGAMHIRPYRPTDRSQILALQQRSDASLAATVPDSFYDDLKNIESAYAGGSFIVADSNGSIVGMGGLLRTGEIVRMRVDPQHRRNGIASRILTLLIARAHEEGMARVFLHTLEQQIAAQKLYLAAGVKEAERGKIHGNSVIAYERLLAETVDGTS